MKKLLKGTTIFAVLTFFINFITYQTSRMQKPVSFNFIEILIGRTFMVNGVAYNSGFSVYAAIGIGCALLAAAAAWTIRNKLALRIAVATTSIIAVVAMTLCISAFNKDAAFPTLLDTVVRGGVDFRITLPFSVIIATLVLNALACFTTERFAVNLVRYKWYYIMVLPAIVFVVVFVYIPMAGLSIVFMDYNIQDIFQSSWVGMKWFKLLWDNLDSDFGRVLGNTLIISLQKMVVTFPAPIVLAILINECRGKWFKRSVQTLSYLPNFVSWSIIAGLFISLLSSQYSVLNGVLTMMGNDRGLYLLNEVKSIRAVLVITSLWKGVGWGSIIYIAALTGVNPELFESAKLDGAGKLAQIWHISLPGIAPLITMQFIFTMPGLLGDNYDQIMNFVLPLTAERGKTLSVYIYEIGVRNQGSYGIGGNYSFSTAIGFCNMIISFLLLIGANSFGRWINPDGAVW